MLGCRLGCDLLGVGGVDGVGGVGVEFGEATGILDLDAVGEDLNADVVSCVGVRAVQHCVDKSFEPDVARNDLPRFEPAAWRVLRASLRG